MAACTSSCTALRARCAAAAPRPAPAAARPLVAAPRVVVPFTVARGDVPSASSAWDDVPLFGDSSSDLAGPATGTSTKGKKKGALSLDDVDITSEAGVDYTLLKTCLAEGRYEDADDEHRRLLIELAGPNAVKRGWVYFTEIRTIPVKDMKVLDELWLASSNGKFGFSVQKKLFDKNRKQWMKFFIEINWVQGEKNIYRKWPKEFFYELKDAPKGHLPLTNALRGTRLFEEIFAHPAFAVDASEKPAWM